MISKEEYRNLKAYYDYQRLREYNKEKLRERINQLIEQFDDEEEVNIDKMFERMWADIDEEDFDRPIPWGWVPKDPKWRLWNE
tara:strand:- start:607 stop:855 length:249 start_codon:yes stop_codon:yes gene_type:complete